MRTNTCFRTHPATHGVATQNRPRIHRGLRLRMLCAVGVDQEPQLLDVNAVLLVALWLHAVLERLQEFLPCHDHLSATRVLSWVISTGRTIDGIAPGPAPLVPNEPERHAFDLLKRAAVYNPAGPGTVLRRPRCPPSRW